MACSTVIAGFWLSAQRFANSRNSKILRNKNPGFTDLPKGCALSNSSPAIDAGTYLTTVAPTDQGSGTSLIVNNASPFQPGWGGTIADKIAVGAVDNIAEILKAFWGARLVISTKIKSPKIVNLGTTVKILAVHFSRSFQKKKRKESQKQTKINKHVCRQLRILGKITNLIDSDRYAEVTSSGKSRKRLK